MSPCRLKIYRGPEESTAREVSTSDVTASVGEILPLLADAMASDRTWLRDFEDEEITLSPDLYEVLMAYQFFRRPGA